jgi:hypothetical protein
MASRLAATVIAFVGLVGFSCGLCAQQAKTPSLEEILARLEANLNHYDTSVPSLFCDEQVVSRMDPSVRNQDMTTDSVFRLKRTENADHTTTLVESREIRKVNGKAPTSQDMKGPTLLNGAFEGGLAVVSLSQRACMSYTLQRINENRPSEPYVVRFATKLTPENSANCLLEEKSKGRVFIDPASMQITHLELTTPDHVIIPGNYSEKPVVGERDVTVDYAPVELGGDSFWMPSAITMRTTSGEGTFNRTVWTFRATYANYHRLEVKSRILPGEAAAP